MIAISNGQKNRYLGSPYTIENTHPNEQTPFSSVTVAMGNFITVKEKFFTGHHDKIDSNIESPPGNDACIKDVLCEHDYFNIK